MGVVKNKNNKKDVANGKTKNPKRVDDNTKEKKKKKGFCLQCIKPMDDGGLEGKYRVAAPELMQDTFMSDSEDEGGEVECPIQQQQQYRYMNSEAGTLHRARPLEDSVTDGHLWPSNNDKKVATIDRQPLDIGFLVSFVVDARGGAMKAKRRGGVRIVVPPAACAAPTRVTCRAASRRAPVAAPPPLMEGEALASRLLELQPQGAKFLAPVIIEVPIFTASCREREIVILRSDTGETWQDHYLHHNDNPMIQEALAKERLEHGNTGETLGENGERVTRIVTCDFPHYLAVVSRVRQEVHIIGPEGGTVSSAAIPQVQAQFPPAALTKRIRVGLQAHGAAAALAARLPRCVAVAPVLTVEPRRRKFHRAITLTAPLPVAQSGEKQSSSNLRLLCSIMGGQARAVWEDVTGSTPLTITGDCASFTTTVSARFWLMNCQNVSDATKQATELYREMLLVPFEVRLVVLGKRLDPLEGRLLVLYITDRYAYETLLQQEHYVEVAHSTAVRLADGKDVYLEFSGNLLPVTKCGSQPVFKFEAFKDNRVEFPVRVKHHEEKPYGRIYFMSDPKVPKGEQSQTPACVLDVELPDRIAPRAGKSHADCLNLDQSGFDALNDELSTTWGEHHSFGPASLPHDTQLNGHVKHISNGDVKITDITDPKPQANGAVHSDSSKTKATFDSDEDKTPHSTLEKGKGKKDGSFLGGLADKVKNVLSNDDEQKSKESSPKPQPKPRDNKSQEKDSPNTKKESTPKPAPRIIKEDLLDKVEDMFKDLQRKPKPHEDEDPSSEVYKTKLIVDDDKAALEDIKEEMYKNMQAVDTPACNKKSDPFEFYTGCCDGRYKPGEKHTHDETSNLVDRIEQEKFSQKEKLSELGDRVQNDLDDSLDKIRKEKENVQQKSNEVIEGLAEKSEKVKDDFLKEGHGFLADTKQGFDHFDFLANERTHTAVHLAQEKLDKSKSAAKDIVDHVTGAALAAKNDLTDKAHHVEFNVNEKTNEVGADLKNKAQNVSNAIYDSVQTAEANVNQKAQDLKQGAKNVAENVKDDVSETVENVKKGAKEKKKKGKGFISGLVNNIFGEKDKIESEVKGKISEGKDQANDLLNQAVAKKDEVKETMSKKQEELKEGGDHLAHNVQAKKDEVVSNVQDKTNEVVAKAQATKDEVVSQVENKKDALVSKAQATKDGVVSKTNEMINQVESKKDELVSNAQATKDDMVSKVQDKTNEVVNQVEKQKDELVSKAQAAKDEVAFKTNEMVNQAENKKNELVSKVQATKDDVVSQVQDKTNEMVNQAENKKDELVSKAQAAKYEVVSKVQGKTNEVVSKVQDAKDEFQTEAESRLQKIRKEAEQATDDIKRSAEDVLNSAADKKTDLQSNIEGKYYEFKDQGNEALHRAQTGIADRLGSLEKSSKDSFEAAQDAALSTFGKIENTAKDRGMGAQDIFEDLQSTTRDTYAGFQDDIHGLESSGQDTLRSFQSSAGNTFDSLDDSAREVFGGVQTTAQNFGDNSKQLFGEAKDSFEGFQVSADNKLEDLKHTTGDTLERAGDRLSETREGLVEGARGTAYEVEEGAKGTAEALASEADKFTSNLNNLGSEVFGLSGKGFMKDSSSKLLESEKSQSSPSPNKKSSGIPKLKKKKK